MTEEKKSIRKQIGEKIFPKMFTISGLISLGAITILMIKKKERILHQASITFGNCFLTTGTYFGKKILN